MSMQLGFGFDDSAVPATIAEPAPVLPTRGDSGGQTASRAADAEGEQHSLAHRPSSGSFQDGIAGVAIAGFRNMMVPWFLIASWGYYVADVPLITDALFDQLCRDLDAEWDSIEHKHKYLIERSWLAAGTCGLGRTAYPASVRGAAAHLARSVGLLIPRE